MRQCSMCGIALLTGEGEASKKCLICFCKYDNQPKKSRQSTVLMKDDLTPSESVMKLVERFGDQSESTKRFVGVR